VDNTLWSYKVADASAQDKTTVAIRNFNEMIREDPRVEIALTTIGDGVTFVRKI